MWTRLTVMRTKQSTSGSRWKNEQIKRLLFWDTIRAIEPAPKKPAPQTWSNDAVTFAWLGHATVLINFFGITILTDPVLAGRVGINAGPFVIGPKRYVQPALNVKELPPIDLVLISHCHFDHLDMWTLRRLGLKPAIVAPSNTADLFSCVPQKAIHEVAWQQRLKLFGDRGGLTLEAFPTAHWGARMGSDGHRKWNGYVIERRGVKLIFGGDTGPTHLFGELHGKGPFDLAIMPIGAYDPWKTNHCSPEQAVAMADAAGARFILPIHHQTFVLSREPLDEPITRLQRALAHTPERIAARGIGDTFVLPPA